MPARRNSVTPLRPFPFWCAICHRPRRKLPCRKHKPERRVGGRLAWYGKLPGSDKTFAIYQLELPLDGEVDVVPRTPGAAPVLPDSSEPFVVDGDNVGSESIVVH